MFNVFNSIVRVYESKWFVKNLVDSDGNPVDNPRHFNDREKALIEKGIVVKGDYGNCACFFMKCGGQSYIPLAESSALGLGDEVDLEKCRIVVLAKPGEKDIVRLI